MSCGTRHRAACGMPCGPALLAGLLLAAALLGSGCLTLSQSARHHVVEEGKLRCGWAMGLGRALGADVEYAEPEDRDPEELIPPIAVAILLETSMFYGLDERVDLGFRLRMPANPAGLVNASGKVESLVQILSQRLWGDPMNLAVGIGLDGFYRPFSRSHEYQTEVRTPDDDSRSYYSYDNFLPDGGFNLSYHGLALEVPIVASVRANRILSLFGGLRCGYLMIDATQRYEPADPGFDTIEYTKEVRELTWGWNAGLVFETPRWRVSGAVIPQIYGLTLDIPNRGMVHQVGGSVEISIQF